MKGTLSIHLINDTVKGKVYGTEAEHLLIQYAKDELDLSTIYEDAVHRNLRSIHILIKLGFEHYDNDMELTFFKLC